MYANAGDDVQTLEITLEDKVGEMRLTLFYSVFYELDIITRHAVFTNLSDEEAILGAALSAAVDFDRADLDIITNYGTHCAERQIERAPLRRGKTVLSSRRGASSHVHNPFLILCDSETSETAGSAYGLVLVYSGSFSASVEGTQFGAARALIGLNPEGFGWMLEPGASFTTPGSGSLLLGRRAGWAVPPLPQSVPPQPMPREIPRRAAAGAAEYVGSLLLRL